MWTLGLHIGLLHRDTDGVHRLHSNFDSAAALLDDGVVVAACRESTLSGVARDKRFPAQAIRFCLDVAGRSLHDMDAIALDQDETILDAMLLQRALDDAREQMRGARACVADMFAACFDADVSSRLRFVDHTTAHMRAAFFGSGLQRATSMCFDGAGSEALAVVAEQDAASVRVLKRIAPGCSLTDLIDTVSDSCGLGGLRAANLYAAAARGDPARYREVMRKMYVIAPGDELYLRERSERLHVLRDAGVLQAIAQADASGKAAIQCDLAASLQAAVGDLVEHVLFQARRLSGCSDLCIGGELAHDPYSIGRVLRAAAFDRVWVAPVGDDAGNAIGAAAHVASAAGHSGAAPHVRWGRAIDEQDLAARLASWSSFVVAEPVLDPAAMLAQQLAQGKTVAWLRGRSEWSERGLSSRVLLSDPRVPCVGARHGLACVPSASIPTLFECVDAVALPLHADYCLMPREDAKTVPANLLGADGSVALHAVDAGDAQLHDAIREFERLTGVPFILGRTFFSLQGVPGDSVDDAIACMLARPIDALVVGDQLVQPKPPTDTVDGFFAELVPCLARGRELSCAIPSGEGIEYAIARRYETEHVADGVPMSLSISRGVFDLLQSRDVHRLCDALERLAPDAGVRKALYEEVTACWRAGFIELRPAAATGSSFTGGPHDTRIMAPKRNASELTETSMAANT